MTIDVSHSSHKHDRAAMIDVIAVYAMIQAERNGSIGCDDHVRIRASARRRGGYATYRTVSNPALTPSIVSNAEWCSGSRSYLCIKFEKSATRTEDTYHMSQGCLAISVSYTN